MTLSLKLLRCVETLGNHLHSRWCVFICVCDFSYPFTLQSSNDKSGVSYQFVLKYILKKYPGMDLDKKKFLIRKAMKKHLEKGTIRRVTDVSYGGIWIKTGSQISKQQLISSTNMCLSLSLVQLKGQGLSGTFAIGKANLSKVFYSRGKQ